MGVDCCRSSPAATPRSGQLGPSGALNVPCRCSNAPQGVQQVQRRPWLPAEDDPGVLSPAKEGEAQPLAALHLAAEKGGDGLAVLCPQVPDGAELVPGLAVLQHKVIDDAVLPGPDGGQHGRVLEEALQGLVGEAPDAVFLLAPQEALLLV